ncbi:MAG: hypothetical protein WBG86_07410, partial [Polyangiales bacterium]
MKALTPKQLLLQVLRVTSEPLVARELVAIAELFGFEDNAVRVALARLVQGDLAANHQSRYSLTNQAERLNRWVESWRQGERRIRKWRGEWLCVLQARGGDRTKRRKSTLALERLGFRKGLPRLWVRPNNLRAGRYDIEIELVGLGLAEDAEIFVGGEFAPALNDSWVRELWPVEDIQTALRDSLDAIERSRRTLGTQPDVRALVESFLIGGRAVRQLALDPL